MAKTFKSALKSLRYSQPFNWLATSTLRAVGLRSEAVIHHLHRVGVVRVKLPNQRSLALKTRADDWISNQIFWRGWDGYEAETVPLFFRLGQRSQTTFDVGAYIGYFTLLAAHANPQGRVYAFEPLPPIYKRLRRNIAFNRVTNVKCFPFAVGAATGANEFFYSKTATLPSSSSLSAEFMHGTKNLTQAIVQVVSLDEFVAEHNIGRIDLLKIDTETTEAEVLRGMRATLQRDHPLIVCEVLPRPGVAEALTEVLEPLGYRYYHLTPEGPVLRDKIGGHPELLNYLFTTLSPDEVSQL